MAAFIEANDVLAWVEDVSEVAFNLLDACEAVGGEFDSLSHDVYKLEKAFRTVTRDSKTDGSPFCLGIPQYRVKFEQVIQDCQRSFQVLGRILQRNALSQDVSPNSIDPLIQIGQELRSHTTRLKEVHRRTKIASTEVLYGQLGTLIRDIQSRKRDPRVLGRIVNLDALSKEMEMIPPNTLISPDETKSLESPPRLQIPQSTIHEINTPTPSPGSRSPVVPAQLNEAKPPELPSQIQTPQSHVQQNDSAHHSPPPKLTSLASPTKYSFQNYQPPTVEDCEDGDEEAPADPFTLDSAASQRPSDGSAKSTWQSSTQTFSKPSVGSKGSTANSLSSPTPPPNNGDFSPPKRTDTDLLRTKKDKGNVQEEIEKVKETIRELEQQKSLESFREFCRRWSAEDALGVQQESRPLPDPTRRTFFVKPSGKIVEKGGSGPLRDNKSKNPLHHEQRPTPLRRSSTMDSFNSFHDPRSPRGNFSDIDFNGHSTESPRMEGHRGFRYEPPVGSSARYMPNSYGATSNVSSGYTPTTYGSPGYEGSNHSTNSFDSPSLGSPGYFGSSNYNNTQLAPSSYGSYGPLSHEPSSYVYSTSNPNNYDRSAASSYDSYDGYPRPQHPSPFTNITTTNATATDPRYVPSFSDTSSTQPFFNVSPRSSTSLTPIPSPTGATTEKSPVLIPTTSAKGENLFKDWIESCQPTQNSRHRHRSHQSRNVEPESMDRDRYPPPLPPKNVDIETKAGRSGGTGNRRLPARGTPRR